MADKAKLFLKRMYLRFQGTLDKDNKLVLTHEGNSEFLPIIQKVGIGFNLETYSFNVDDETYGTKQIDDHVNKIDGAIEKSDDGQINIAKKTKETLSVRKWFSNSAKRIKLDTPVNGVHYEISDICIGKSPSMGTCVWMGLAPDVDKHPEWAEISKKTRETRRNSNNTSAGKGLAGISEV